MLRRLLRIGLVSILIVAAAPLTASRHEDSHFEADLDADQEVATPSVVSDGEGDAEFTVKRNRIKFKLRWEDLTSRVIFAHIHCGVAGENRPVGVTLLHETKRADGRISGSFSGPDAENRCGWCSAVRCWPPAMGPPKCR